MKLRHSNALVTLIETKSKDINSFHHCVHGYRSCAIQKPFNILTHKRITTFNPDIHLSLCLNCYQTFPHLLLNLTHRYSDSQLHGHQHPVTHKTSRRKHTKPNISTPPSPRLHHLNRCILHLPPTIPNSQHNERCRRIQLADQSIDIINSIPDTRGLFFAILFQMSQIRYAKIF